MNDQTEQVFLSEGLLRVMRTAAAITLRLGGSFITTRALLLALLEEPEIGVALADVIPKERLEALPASEGPKYIAGRVPEPPLPIAERADMQRYDTLAFKVPDGTNSVWLSREALIVFQEGAQRAEGHYLPKHLAFGIAAQAVRTPGVLASLHVSPGAVNDAIYKL
ncbi:MAG: hypothetical protein ACYDGM_06100 [Vulcanimicrobiaceae bacterium]